MEAPLRSRDQAKTLRRALSLPEVLLWKQVRGRRLNDLHFRKQHPIGPYVLDFYCDTAKLCVEVDGEAHSVADRPQRDARRDAWLKTQGVRTLRLRATYVMENMTDALRMIAAAAAEPG